MVRQCTVKDCKKSKEGHGVSLHKVKKSWIDHVSILNQDYKNKQGQVWQVSAYSYICSQHFLESDYDESYLSKKKLGFTSLVPTLKSEAVPRASAKVKPKVETSTTMNTALMGFESKNPNKRKRSSKRNFTKKKRRVSNTYNASEPNSSNDKEENTEPDVGMATDFVTVKTEPVDMDYDVFLNQPDTKKHLEQDKWYNKDDGNHNQTGNEQKGSIYQEITEPSVAMTMDFINIKSEPVAVFINQSNTKHHLDQHLEQHLEQHLGQQLEQHNKTHGKEDREQNQTNFEAEDSIYNENCEPGVTMATDFISVKTEPDMDYAVFLNQSDMEQHLKDNAQSHLEIDQYYDSDMFFRTCFIDDELWPDTSLPEQKTDLDGDTADAFYVMVNRFYKYDPHSDLDSLVESKTKLLYSQLKDACKACECEDFVYLKNSKFVRFIQMYDDLDYPAVKICVTILKDFSVDIKVNNLPVPPHHMMWTTLPARCYHVGHVVNILKTIGQYNVCSGNEDKELQDLIPVPVGASSCANEALEDGYNGFRDLISGESTIRSKQCNLLVKRTRCYNCQNYRRTLKKTELRLKVRLPDLQVNWLKSKKTNPRLTDAQKLCKLDQQKKYITELEKSVNSLLKLKRIELIEKRKITKESDFRQNEITLNNESLEKSQIIDHTYNAINVGKLSGDFTEKSCQDENVIQMKMKNDTDSLEKTPKVIQSEVNTKLLVSPTAHKHTEKGIVFKCKVRGCGYTGGRKSDMVHHEQSHNNYTICCKYCNFKTNRQDMYKTHNDMPTRHPHVAASTATSVPVEN